MLLVAVAVAMGAGIAWAATRTVTATGGSGPIVAAPPVAPVAPSFPQVSTNSNSTPQISPRPAPGAPPKAPSGNDLINLVGKLGGLVGGESAFTNTAKDASLPVGMGVATVAIIAGAGSSLSVAALWVAPIFLITVTIITIIDGIARTDQANRWKAIVVSVRDLRAAGQIREAMEVYRRAAGQDGLIGADESGQGGYVGNVGGDISKISRVWPQPGEDWFNTADPLGRPYPGFPGPPEPATLAEIAANPGLLPETITNEDGQSYDVRELLKGAVEHVAIVRAWGLANGAVGELPAWAPGWGTGATAGRSATDPARPLVTTKTGPRDITKWPDLMKAANDSARLLASIRGAFPWLGALPVPVMPAHPLDLAAQVTAFRAGAAVVEGARRKSIQTARNFGGGAAGAAEAAVVAAETAAEVAANAARRAQAAADTAADTEARTGGRTAVNRSGGGGRTA